VNSGALSLLAEGELIEPVCSRAITALSQLWMRARLTLGSIPS
jgi:hypothetical protein